MLRQLAIRVLTISFLGVHLFIFVNHPSAPPVLLLSQPTTPPAVQGRHFPSPIATPPSPAQAPPRSGRNASRSNDSLMRQVLPPPASNITAPCYDGRSLVVAITRSVVAPKRRYQRLEAISRTWGRDLVRIGATVMVLSMEPESECADLRSPFNCLTPPMDLVARKAEVFTWLITKVLLPLDGPQRVSHLLWVNDHSFIIPGNLVKYLSGVSHGEMAHYPLYAGKVLVSGGRRFNSGAAGIILNRAAMLRFQLLTDPGPRQRRECFPPHLQNASQPRLVVVEDNKSFGRVKEPGLILADCLKASGMGPNRTRDGGQNGTEDKFHAFGPQRVYAGTTDEWYKNYHGACRNGVGCGKEDIGQRLANESQCCSSDTISFHYVEKAENEAIYAVLQDQQKFRTATKAALSAELGLIGGKPPQQNDGGRSGGGGGGGGGGDWRVGFWPPAPQLSYSTPPKPHDGMWEFLAKKLHVAPLSAHLCGAGGAA